MSDQNAVANLRRRIEELEAQLAQQQKLMAIGSLAGGVAHDFNNLLTAILGYSSLLRDDPTTPPHVMEAVEVIEKAAERASQLTGQLLGFARKGDPKRIREVPDIWTFARDVTASNPNWRLVATQAAS